MWKTHLWNVQHCMWLLWIDGGAWPCTIILLLPFLFASGMDRYLNRKTIDDTAFFVL